MVSSPRSSSSGQASADYVALLAVVALVLGAAVATVGSPPALASAVSGAVRHGICLVAGGVCTAREARAAGLAPCLVHARGERERLAAKALVVRLERGDALLVERRSDGSATVSFLDGWRGGATAGIGLKLPWGSPGSISGSAGAQFTGGRTWAFASAAAAARFVRRWKRRESFRGEATGLARGLCRLCARAPAPPPPQATYREGGAYGEVSGELGLRLPRLRKSPRLAIDGDADVVAGRRISGRRTTLYLRVDYASSARLGAVIGAVSAAQQVAPALEVSLEAGRAVELRVHGAAAMRGQLDLLGATTSLSGLAKRLRSATGGGRGGEGTGMGVEAAVSLDLTDQRNRDAAVGVLELLGMRARPSSWDERIRALGQRLDADGAVDVGVFRVGASERETEFEGAFGGELGGRWSRSVETRELIEAWSLRRGGALSEREDCSTPAG